MGAIVVVGSLNMDMIFRVARAPDAGETIAGRSFATAPGGKGANQAIACARMGASAAMIGCVGADAFGEALLAGLKADGVDATLVLRRADAPSGVAMVMVDDDAQNRIVITPGANALLSPAMIEAARPAFARAQVVVLQLETPMESVMRAAQVAREEGARVLLNPAPAQALPDALLALVDDLIPNETEASILTGIDVRDRESATAAAGVLTSRGVGKVLVTLGAQGVLIADGGETRLLPARRVAAIDTTAAGDTFIGAYATALAEGADVVAAAELGRRAAALCVTREGAQPSIPHRREI